MSAGYSLQHAYIHATRPLLPGWDIVQVLPDGYACQSLDGLRVIVSGAVEADGRRWLHVSVSRSDRLPSWEDMTRVKALIIGPDRYAYQIHPPAILHVNLHPRVLHLWSCWDAPDGKVLPEFSSLLPDGRRSL